MIAAALCNNIGQISIDSLVYVRLSVSHIVSVQCAYGVERRSVRVRMSHTRSGIGVQQYDS